MAKYWMAYLLYIDIIFITIAVGIQTLGGGELFNKQLIFSLLHVHTWLLSMLKVLYSCKKSVASIIIFNFNTFIK